jgi:hypothetical protein
MKEQLKQQILSLPSDWVLIPINDKNPGYENWNTIFLTRQEIIDRIEDGKSNGVGVLTGKLGQGLLGVDFDGASTWNYFEQEFGKPHTDLPVTVEVTSGKPGRSHKLFVVPEQYRDAIRTRKFNTGVKDEQIELRWNGLQTAIAGVHPTTGSYRWINSPHEIDVAEAPLWLIEKMLVDRPKKTSSATNKGTYKPRNSDSGNSDAARARSFLAAINPLDYDDYDNWLKVGLALHSVGDDSLLEDWDKWSQASPKYEPGVCETKWNSFNSAGVELGTLGHMAKQNGWKSKSTTKKDSEMFKEELQIIQDTTDFEERVRLIALFCTKHRISRNSVDEMLRRRENISKADNYESSFVSLS